MKIWLIGIVIGMVSGVIAALCGVGGGVVMVPAFVFFLGLAQKTAVATSLAVIVPTAVAASAVNWKNGLIHLPTFAATAIGATVAAALMAERLKALSDQTLTRIFAIVLVLMGVRMWFQPPSKPASPPGDVQKIAAKPTDEAQK